MLSNTLAEEVISCALSTGGDYAEIFVEDTVRNTINLDKGSIGPILSGKDFGASVRVFFGTRSVYAYTNDISRSSLLELAKRAASSGTGIDKTKNITIIERYNINRSRIEIAPASAPNGLKVDYLKQIYQFAMKHDRSIVDALISYKDIDQKIFIATSDGFYGSDHRCYSRVNTKAIADFNGMRQVGTCNTELQRGLEHFKIITPQAMAVRAGTSAVNLLSSKPSPMGQLPVVLARGEGTFVHEACGHALEACCVSEGGSIYSGKLGEKVAAPIVSVCDDGTVPNAYGTLNIDDEGIMPTKNMLIRDGVLVGYMVDRLSGIKMGLAPTGCGRKESYRYCPTSRMTNTFICPGNDDEEDIIKSVEYGLYVKEVGGGTAHVSTGGFDFVVSEAYMIENGEITCPVRGATLSGNAKDALMNIEMVGNKMGESENEPINMSGALCGASSGQIPVTDTIPMIKIKSLTVGGK